MFAAAAAAALMLLGPLVLSILGHSYATNGAAPLRIIALAALPMVVVKVYLATCRATGRMLEGTLMAGTVGALAVVLGALAAGGHGLVGIATIWLAVQSLGAGFGALRLHVILHPDASRAGDVAHPPSLTRRPSSVAGAVGERDGGA